MQNELNNKCYIDPLFTLTLSLHCLLMFLGFWWWWKTAWCGRRCILCPNPWQRVIASIKCRLRSHFIICMFDALLRTCFWHMIETVIYKLCTVYVISCFSPYFPNLNVEVRVLKVFLVLIVGRTLLMLTFYLNSVKPSFHENSEIRHIFL